MKTLRLASGLAFVLLATAAAAQSRLETLHVGGPLTLTIASNETAKVVASRTIYCQLTITKGGSEIYNPVSNNGGYEAFPAATVVGPAVLTLSGTGGSAKGYCTIEILPDAFPIDKTIVVPQDTGANIILEASTNLIQWAPAPPGLYTNRVGNMFFRIRAERILLPSSP